MTWIQIPTIDNEGPSAISSTLTLRDPQIDRELQELAELSGVRRWSKSPIKRAFDVIVSGLVLLLFSVPGLVIALVIRLTSNGPAIFVQKRVGRHGKLFAIYKFRSMRHCSEPDDSPTLTRDGDCRITGIGRWLRKFKLDELPQFYNVFRGDMSLIGPRPKLPQYAEILDQPYRPGITGAATIAFRREEELLRNVPASELDAFYNARIKPLKTLIDVRYMAHGTFPSDIWLVVATFLTCLMPAQFSKRMTNVLLSSIPLHLVDRLTSESNRKQPTRDAIIVESVQEAAQV